MSEAAWIDNSLSLVKIFELSFCSGIRLKIIDFKSVEKSFDNPDNPISLFFCVKYLPQVKAHELVECINPEVRKGRLYRLTDKSDEIVKNLEKQINNK